MIINQGGIGEIRFVPMKTQPKYPQFAVSVYNYSWEDGRRKELNVGWVEVIFKGPSNIAIK